MSKVHEKNKMSKNIQSKSMGNASFCENKPVSKKNSILILLGIIAITVIAYYPVSRNQILNWDDNTYINENPYIHSFAAENVKTLVTKGYFNNYHPITMLSYNLDYKIGKADPEVYVITNLILHIFNTVIVFWFILLLTKLFGEIKDYSNNNKIRYLLASIASLLFAIHPINVESVAWISERKNLLCALFFLLSLISYIKYLNKNNSFFYYGSLILFLLSLLSKGTAVSLSLCIIALDYLYARKLFSYKVLFEKIPYFLLSLTFGIIAVHCQAKTSAPAILFSTSLCLRLMGLSGIFSI